MRTDASGDEAAEPRRIPEDETPYAPTEGIDGQPPSADDRLQLLFDNMLEGFAYHRMLYDEQGRPDDFEYLAVNPAFSSLTGLSNVVGKKATEVVPGIRESNPELFEIYDRVTKTGEPHRFEVEVEQLETVFRVSVFRPEPGHFVTVFENITERKQLEKELNELNRYLEYRVEERTRDLAEALRLRQDE